MATGRLDIYISGCDDHEKRTTANPIPWVEAGQKLTGLLSIEYPGSVENSGNLSAQVDFKIESTYDCNYRIEWSDKDGSFWKDVIEPEVFNTREYHHNSPVLSTADAQQVSFDPRCLWIRFDIELPGNLPQSTPPSGEKKSLLGSKQFGGSTSHKLSIKVSVLSTNISTEWMPRDLLILAKRPTLVPHQRPKPILFDKYEHAKMSLGSDALVYMEGDPLSIVGNIELLNTSSLGQGISEVKMKLVAKYTSTQFVFHSPNHHYQPPNYFRDWYGAEHYQKASKSICSATEEIASVKVRGLNLRPLSNQNRGLCFGSLPKLLDYVTTDMEFGFHKRTIEFFIELEFDKMVSYKDYKATVPIAIYPCFTSRSTLASLSPTLYPPASLPTTYCGFQRKMFVLRILRAEGLPRMDGPLGKADPYCTVLVNDMHFRCTQVQSRTLSPQWNEDFTFYVYEQDYSKDISLILDCFDDDVGNHDDLIGSVSTVLTFEKSEQTTFFAKALEISRPTKKSGKVEKTGIVYVEYMWR
mmetsp:Transcript_11307/g.19308  ORF Transcript_11307/g.19308 Transcript_11307/m.19308 type:complete len:525 (-) Transcript_11307:331-1905(-)